MLKSLNEKLDDKFMERSEKMTESVNEKEINSETMKAEFAELEAIHKKYFPKSEAWYKYSALGRPALFFYTTLQNRTEWANGYAENDSMPSSFSITYKGDGKYVFEILNGDALRVEPAPGSYYAFDRVKVPFRKYTGTTKQILAKFDAWSKKRLETVEANKDKIKKF